MLTHALRWRNPAQSLTMTAPIALATAFIIAITPPSHRHVRNLLL